MASLLHTLNTEVGALDHAGTASLDKLLGESNSILSELRTIEAELQSQVSAEKKEEDNGNSSNSKINASDMDHVSKLEDLTQGWYNQSISALKEYNGQTSRFSRNVVNASAFGMDLDGAYMYPLALNSVPTKEIATHIEDEKSTAKLAANNDENRVARSVNRKHLLHSIVTHFFKTGHAGIVADLLEDFGVANDIDPKTLGIFIELGEIVSEIREKHEVTRALAWFKARADEGKTDFEHASLKFHLLQFILLLANDIKGSDETPQDTSSSSRNIEMAFSAYTYAKKHFLSFFKDHVDEISPVFSLLLFKTANAEDSARHLALLKQNMHKAFVSWCDTSNRSTDETRFIAEILEKFDHIRESSGLFERLANEFLHAFCSAQALSTESPLFHAMLSGYVNFPNFYKYNQVQQKLRRKSVPETEQPEAVNTQDLPFPSTTKNQFLFGFHPIFICPISKEQSMPLSSVVRVAEPNRKQIFISANEVLVPPANPVVVFMPCCHLALKESIRDLGRGGSFKCHYCYKIIGPEEVSNAYFIDL